MTGIDPTAHLVEDFSDPVAPSGQSRAVAARAGGPTRVISVEGADHNDPVLLDGAPVIDAVVQLAERIGG